MSSNTIHQEYFRKDHHQHFKIHLVCYNILAQDLLEDNSYLYTNCFRNNLKWYRRKDRLLREILRQNADVGFILTKLQKLIRDF
jgi:mRNA deadenylase 3'-5' endonuclease subunit Ccr4